MPISDELATLDGTAQAELVRNGEMTPLELVDAAIARIERLNPQLNAVVTPLFDEARKTARGALPEGPLRGVPYLLKDLGAACAGVRYTLGSAFTKDFVALVDAELVLRHRRAGLVCLGKTNTPEFGIQPTTEPLLFGPTHNPWDLSRTPGGSSGGSAAAVAAGLVPLAHANDGGGSIRIPASCCGLFGLKPTRARNPLGPVFGDIMGGFVQEHAVTRSVRDSAALLDATAGPDVGDPYCAQPPARPFLEEVGADPGRLRIAFTTTALNGAAVHADCVAAVQDAAALCEALGHHVEEAAPALDGPALTGMFVTVWAAGCADTVEALAKATGRKAAPAHFEPLTWALYEMGAKVSAASYLNTVTGLQQAARAVARFMSGFDLLLCPTVAEPPPPLGTFDSPPEAPLKGFGRAGEFVPFTQLANMTGQPAMSVPLFWNAAGLPIGAHFMARFGDEAALFRLAAQLEEARPWAGRRPPVFA